MVQSAEELRKHKKTNCMRWKRECWDRYMVKVGRIDLKKKKNTKGAVGVGQIKNKVIEILWICTTKN